MNAARKRVGKKRSGPAKEPASGGDSPAVSRRRGSSPHVDTRSIFDDCAGAICLVEVTMHSLESREIGHPEQEVLKRALKLIWSVHDWIDENETRSNDADDENYDGDGAP